MKSSDMNIYELIIKSPTHETVEKIFHDLNGTLQDKKNLMDLKIRMAMHLSMKNSNRIISTESKNVCYLSLSLSESNIFCSINLVFTVMQDMLESARIESLPVGVDLLNEMIPRLMVDPLYPVGKYILLRMCNDLLKRHSNVRDNEICGQIQMILSKIFPLNEKSALNLTSEFNADKQVFPMQETSSADINPKYYRNQMGNEEFFFSKFWEIQECLTNPNIILISDQSWEKFKSNLENILHIFKVLENPNSSTANKNCHSIGGEIFFPKYTANPRLIESQIDDPEFRQQILLQFYIMTSFLKFKGKFQKLELTLNQLEWCDEVLAKIYAIFEKYDSINGSDFSVFFNRVVKNDDTWIEWKNKGCPSFYGEQHNVSSPSFTWELDYQDWDFSKQQTFDNPRLNYLWNICPDNSEACKVKGKQTLNYGSLSDFLSESQKLFPVPDFLQRICQQPSFQWRVLRLLSKEYPQYFSAVSSASLPSFIQSVLSDFIDST